MPKTGRQGNVTAGTDLASVLAFIAIWPLVSIIHVVLLVRHPRRQIAMAIGAVNRGSQRLYLFIRHAIQNSRFAQSMRELLADSS